MGRCTLITGIAALALLAGVASAQQPAAPAPPEHHVRGDVVGVTGDVFSVRSRDGGQVVKVEVGDDTRLMLASKAELGSIARNAFIGTTAVPQADGTLRALEVHVFPESMRGAGEGHRPWDLKPGSTMTNANVAGVAGSKAPPSSTMTNANVAKVSQGAGGLKLVLVYPQGERTVVVPAGIPVVALRPADRARLSPGAHVFAAGPSRPDGTLLAKRVFVGEDGVVPPM